VAADGENAEAVHSTRLFFLPTAKTLEPGHGYVVGHGMLIPSFQVGITPHFSAGAGTFFGFVSWLTPKFQVYNGPTNSAALTAIHFFIPSEDGSFGIAYASFTHGTRRGEWTVGAGEAYSSIDKEWHWSAGGPIIVVGGEHRLSPRTTFVSENFGGLERSHGELRPSVALLLNGLRFEGRRFTFDLAVGTIPHRDLFFVFPFINWSVKF
jgi:hypothetical protein